MTTPGLRLEEALGSWEGRPEDVLDLADEAIQTAAADGDGATLERLARRLDEAATARGDEWRGLAVAAARARALARSAGRAAPLASATPPEPAVPPAPAYGEWWPRVFAVLLDLFVVAFVIGAFDELVTDASIGLDLVLLLAYFAVFPVVVDGVTPGKAAFGLTIRVADGSKIDLVRSLLRAVVTFLLWITVIGLVVDLIVMGVDRRRQSLHDKLAGTIVVRTRA